MSKIQELLYVSENEKRKILEELETTEEEFEESAKNLETWILKNPDFPEDDGFFKERVRMALLNGKMSMERAKQTLEGYFGLRISNEDLFVRLIPDERFRRIQSLVINAPIPKLLPNLSRLLVYRMDDLEESAHDVLEYYEMCLMVSELRFLSDFCLSNEVLIDLRNYTIRKLLRHTPGASQKLANILMSFGARISRIHCINTPAFFDRIIAITKAVLPPKIMDRLIMHRSLDELYEYIPKDYLPSDFNGNLKSMKEIHDEWVEEMEGRVEIFKNFENLKLKNMNKKNKELSPELGLGIDGSFRKLAID